ncbi:putative nuclease HARBI1 isoform X1 [Osmerus mordax]|uniref:putative nuclease HARBI1 isoform X1 n=1 Tax=Osmerus mordax TaxID=8014 RepID=UPI00350F6CC5
MYSGYVESAGRAVLEMMQREWEPLSQGELEQSLDQAVEKILETELLSQVRVQPAPMCLQRVEPQVHAETVLSTESSTFHPEQQEGSETQQSSDSVDNIAVKCITDLLQNSNSSYSRSRLSGRARLSLSHTVVLSLTLLSKRISYRSVSSSFRLEKGNIHRIFFSFCERVNMLEDQLIKWPVAGSTERGSHQPLSSLLGKAVRPEKQDIPTVLGVLGNTRIPIRLPIGKQDFDSVVTEVKKMKKEVHPDSWLNLELVCDFRGRFIHCRISKGSDTTRGSSLKDKLKQHPEMMPPGSCLVARVGYPVCTQILTPFTITHGPRENLYNRTLGVHFCAYDQAIADLKTRFQRLRYLDMGNFERAKAVVLTACILHNVFLDMGQEVRGEIEEEASVQEGEGETDIEGVERREAVAGLLYQALDFSNV